MFGLKIYAFEGGGQLEGMSHDPSGQLATPVMFKNLPLHKFNPKCRAE